MRFGMQAYPKSSARDWRYFRDNRFDHLKTKPSQNRPSRAFLALHVPTLAIGASTWMRHATPPTAMAMHQSHPPLKRLST